MGTKVVLAAVAGGAAALALLSPATAQAAPASPHAHKVCASAAAGSASCNAWLRDDAAVRANATPAGYGPTQLRSAYALPSSGGNGRIVAIVDAYDDPNAFGDVNTYRAQYGIPTLTNCSTTFQTTSGACFAKVNQSGGTSYPRANGGWAQEISLDVDMASAICPDCKILLVEASSTSFANLGAAVNYAASHGAYAVSNSYGGTDTSDSSYGKYYNHPHVAITASSGDSGYGAQYPASSKYVTAVGGTSLTAASNPRGWAESAWSGAGSGCSTYNAKPAWQTDASCATRVEADVSAVADPSTGVAVYDSFTYQGQSGWLVFGGTSVASPIVASVYALAGDVDSSFAVPAQKAWQSTSGLNDVTSGSNGTCSVAYYCTAVPGYDGPTGNGTPNGLSAF